MNAAGKNPTCTIDGGVTNGGHQGRVPGVNELVLGVKFFAMSNKKN